MLALPCPFPEKEGSTGVFTGFVLPQMFLLVWGQERNQNHVLICRRRLHATYPTEHDAAKKAHSASPNVEPR